MQNIPVASGTFYFIPRIILLWEKKPRIAPSPCSSTERRWVWLTEHSNTMTTESKMAFLSILIASLPVVSSLLLPVSRYSWVTLIRYRINGWCSNFSSAAVETRKATQRIFCHSARLLNVASYAWGFAYCWSTMLESFKSNAPNPWMLWIVKEVLPPC